MEANDKQMTRRIRMMMIGRRLISCDGVVKSGEGWEKSTWLDVRKTGYPGK